VKRRKKSEKRKREEVRVYKVKSCVFFGVFECFVVFCEERSESGCFL